MSHSYGVTVFVSSVTLKFQLTQTRSFQRLVPSRGITIYVIRDVHFAYDTPGAYITTATGMTTSQIKNLIGQVKYTRVARAARTLK